MSCLLVKDRNDVVTYECVVLVVWGGNMNVSRKYCPGMKWLAVRAEFYIAVDITKAGGDLKLFLCVAY